MLGDAGAGGAVNPEVARYMNRLSDHLFVLARGEQPRGRPGNDLGAPATGRVEDKQRTGCDESRPYCTATARGLRVKKVPLSVKVAVAV